MLRLTDEYAPGQDVAAQPVACVQIGGVSVRVRGSCVDVVSLNDELLPFCCATDTPDIEVAVGSALDVTPSSSTPFFDSGALWKIFDEASAFNFEFRTGPTLYKRMRAKKDFRAAHVTLQRELLLRSWKVSPLEYPTDELLITNFLAHHALGVEVHGCGLIDVEGGAHLFLGHSGAGKSTTARLWDSLRAAEILSDDRIILRAHNGELWMYGTPWHGEGQFASPRKARLDRIFVLQHGTGNRFIPLAKSRALGELFARCFPPFHSAEGLERTVEFLSRALAIVPCYQFQFTPDSRAVEAVKRFHD